MTELIFNIEKDHAIELLGVNNNRIQFLKKQFSLLKIVNRGTQIKVTGLKEEIEKFKIKLDRLTLFLTNNGQIENEQYESLIAPVSVINHINENIIIFCKEGKPIKARTQNQQEVINAIINNDIVFAVGPAGTGKTFISVALAVKALKNKVIKKIILTRPAVEAGENLGFLPGDLKEKIDPYLRPLFDSLESLLEKEKLNYYLDQQIIEIAPLAYMRGRTLDNAYIILDEAQNTSELQLKMFLTRLGNNAKAIITGDITQVDLPKNQKSGLKKAINILQNIKGIAYVSLTQEDVVRHHLVKKIINAYENDYEYNSQMATKK